MKKENPILLGVELDEHNYSKLRKMYLHDPEWAEKQVRSVAEKFHNGNTTSAIQMLECDLEMQ